MRNDIKDLIVFDFDSTMVNTMMPIEGKEIYFQKTGKEWEHRGWWGRKESLDTDIFDHPINDWVFQQYEKSCELGSHKIILTGRITKLVNEVETLLNLHNVYVDEIICNGHFTKITKTDRFKIDTLVRYIKNNPSLERIVMYDDRKEHLPMFKKWAVQTQKRTGIKIVIDQITNGIGRYTL